MKIMEIGTKMKKMREFRDLTQNDFSELLGISLSSLFNYENNKRMIPLDILVKASNILQVNLLEDVLELIDIKENKDMTNKKVDELSVIANNISRLKEIEENHEKLIFEQEQVIKLQNDLINKQEIIISHNKKVLETYKNN